MKRLTNKQEKEILEKSGAIKINLVRKTMIKPERIKSDFIHEIDEFIFTNAYDERYMTIGLDFNPSEEKTRKAVCVTTKQ